MVQLERLGRSELQALVGRVTSAGEEEALTGPHLPDHEDADFGIDKADAASQKL